MNKFLTGFSLFAVLVLVIAGLIFVSDGSKADDVDAWCATILIFLLWGAILSYAEKDDVVI